MTPEWGCCARDLPPETQFLLLQLADSGPYAVLLPLIDSGRFRVTLRPPGCAAPPTAWRVAAHCDRISAHAISVMLQKSVDEGSVHQAQGGARPAAAAGGERRHGRGGLGVGQRAACGRWQRPLCTCGCRRGGGRTPIG